MPSCSLPQYIWAEYWQRHSPTCLSSPSGRHYRPAIHFYRPRWSSQGHDRTWGRDDIIFIFSFEEVMSCLVCAKNRWYSITRGPKHVCSSNKGRCQIAHTWQHSVFSDSTSVNPLPRHLIVACKHFITIMIEAFIYMLIVLGRHFLFHFVWFL